jgi:transposase
VDTSVIEAPGGRRRRKHTAEFKKQVVRACQQPGVSSAAVALANGVNANLVRRWVKRAEQARVDTLPLSAPVSQRSSPEFVPLQVPASGTAALQPDIRIQLQRAGVSVTVTWPTSAAAQCASWLREILR